LNVRVQEGLPVDRLPDISLKHVEESAAFGRSLEAELARASEKDLSHEEQLSLAILRDQARVLADTPSRYWLTFVTPTPLSSREPRPASAVSQPTDPGVLALASQYADLVRALRQRAGASGIRLPKEGFLWRRGLHLEGKNKFSWVDGARWARSRPGPQWFSNRLARQSTRDQWPLRAS
jgi:hypothetical protein